MDQTLRRDTGKHVNLAWDQGWFWLQNALTQLQYLINQTAMNKSFIKSSMERELERLRVKQTELLAKLNTGFDYETYKKLNLLNQHIECAEVRSEGKWTTGDYPRVSTMPTL
jgi:hypothetical protein